VNGFYQTDDKETPLYCGIFVVTLLCYFLFIFSVCMFMCFLFFPSTFLLVLHAIFLSLFLHSFITYLFLLLCVLIIYFYFFLFSLLFTSPFYFFSWRTRLACVLTVFSSNLRQYSVYFTFLRSQCLHQWYYCFKSHYSHGCSSVFALQRLIQDLQIPRACLN